MNDPLVSIICISKNSKNFIRQCVESVLAQDYDNFEFLIQDGASTDGTVEIIQGYRDPRIKLISELDSGAIDALNRVLKRIKGDIWGSCLSDEEMLPHAISWAVQSFACRTSVAVIYGDAYIIDENGNLIKSSRSQSWNYKRYLCYELVPPFSATFFRTNQFRQSFEGFSDCGEFELWTKMGSSFSILYIPEFVTRFRRHKGSNTSTVSDFYKTLPGRINAIERVVDDPRTPAHLRALKQQALAGLHLWVAENFLESGHIHEARDMIAAALQYAPRRERLTGLYHTFKAKTEGNRLAEPLDSITEMISKHLNGTVGRAPMPSEDAFLFNLVKQLSDDAVIVEFGPPDERSMAAIESACIGSHRKVYSIDNIVLDAGEGNPADILKQVKVDSFAEHLMQPQHSSEKMLSRWREIIGGSSVEFFLFGGCSRSTKILDLYIAFQLVKINGWIAFRGFEEGTLKDWEEIAMHSLSNQGRCGSLVFGQKTGPLPQWIQCYISKLMIERLR